MRLFIAIQFNKEMADALVALQGDLQFCGVHGSYTRPEDLHLTLAFIGEYPDPEKVMDALKAVRFSPFDISLDMPGRFSDLWWAGITDTAPLKAVVRRIRRALSEADIPFDKKRFKPHVTLIRRSKTDGAPPECLFVESVSMRVRRISLMRSDRGKHGMIYTEVGAIDAE